MPYIRSPPGLSYLSYIVTLYPEVLNCSAHAKPAGPDPIIPTL